MSQRRNATFLGCPVQEFRFKCYVISQKGKIHRKTLQAVEWDRNGPLGPIVERRVMMMHRHCAVGNLTYSHAMYVRQLLMFIRCFVCKSPACKKGHNLKTKDLCTHVYVKCYYCFWLYNSQRKFVRLIQNHSVYVLLYETDNNEEGSGMVNNKCLWRVNGNF
jgi:hypothetical protein